MAARLGFLLAILAAYQWKETESESTHKNVGGSTTTKTYSYGKVWSDSRINSSQFKKPEGHLNPATMRHQSREIVATHLTVGSFILSRSLVGRIDNYTELPCVSLDNLPNALKGTCKLEDGRLFFGADPASPAVGDQRISFKESLPTVVSLVARQANSSFEPYSSKAGGRLELLQVGEFSAPEMFARARSMNMFLTWGRRLGGVLLMWFGFGLLTRPLSVLADVVPFFGNLVAFGTGLLSLILATGISLVTAAVAWFWYRPLLSVFLAGVALGMIFLAWRRQKRPRSAA